MGWHRHWVLSATSARPTGGTKIPICNVDARRTYRPSAPPSSWSEPAAKCRRTSYLAALPHKPRITPDKRAWLRRSTCRFVGIPISLNCSFAYFSIASPSSVVGTARLLAFAADATNRPGPCRCFQKRPSRMRKKADSGVTREQIASSMLYARR
jgi:hypothetical protein